MLEAGPGNAAGRACGRSRYEGLPGASCTRSHIWPPVISSRNQIWSTSRKEKAIGWRFTNALMLSSDMFRMSPPCLPVRDVPLFSAGNSPLFIQPRTTMGNTPKAEARLSKV